MPSVEVVLLEDVRDLGQIGDVKSVAAGYARNYLLPQKLAVPATEKRMADSQFHAALEERREATARAEAERIGALVHGTTLTLPALVGDQGRMHGQITNQDVAQALKEQLAVDIDRHLIQIDSPIRSLGRYLLPIKLASGLNVSVTLEVVEQEPIDQESADQESADQESADQESADQESGDDTESGDSDDTDSPEASTEEEPTSA